MIHNTFLGDGINGFIANDTPPHNYNYSNLVMSNNITEFDQQRWFRAVTPANMFCIDPCWSTSTLSGTFTSQNNGIINSGAINGGGLSDSALIAAYGTAILGTLYDTTQFTNYSGAPFASYSTVNTDYHGYALTGSGPWRNAASDGTDPGVNLTKLDAALSGGTDPGVNLTTLDAALSGSSYSPCDVNQDGVVSVLDVQLVVNMNLGLIPCTANINGPNVCQVTTIQRVINASLGGACVTGP